MRASGVSAKEMRESGASRKHVRGCFEFPVPEPRSDSDSETDHDRPQRSGRMLLLCPGCNKPFTNISSLRRHRNSWRLPACRDAASASKRPRKVRVGDSTQDAYDRINEMMGDVTNRGVPPGSALNPCLPPRDEVGDSDLQSLPKVYTKFATCLHIVCTTFASGLHKVCKMFAYS